MTEHEVLVWLIPALGAVISFVGVGILNQLKLLAECIKGLAVDMAVIAEKVSSHERRIRKVITNTTANKQI